MMEGQAQHTSSWNLQTGACWEQGSLRVSVKVRVLLVYCGPESNGSCKETGREDRLRDGAPGGETKEQFYSSHRMRGRGWPLAVWPRALASRTPESVLVPVCLGEEQGSEDSRRLGHQAWVQRF